MIEEIVSGASGAGGLPLCQFAMAELWDARDTTRAIIPERALLAVGGVAGALARHADGLLARLPDLQRDVARTLLLHLVTPEGTRARRTAIELGAFHGATETVLDALVRGRLVVAREVSGETSYEVAHEALLSGWHTLRDWLASDAGTRPLRERVERAAAEWERLGRPAELAWSERQLEQVRVLESGSLAGGSGEFLETSRRRATRRKWQRRGLIAIVPIVVPLVFLGLRLQAQRETDRAVARHAEAAAPLVENGKAARLRAEELRTKAFSLFDAVHGQTFEEAQTESDRAEERWAEALETGRTADTALAQGARALEAGLALDPSREDLRSSIGDVTVERLLLAEAFHQPEKRADLEEQLTGYDSDGSRRAHLATPPVLTLESTPPGADVTLERYVDRAGYRVLVGAKSLGKTPIAGHSLGDGPGSYRLTFVAGGRVEVRYPVLLGRGEEVRLSVDLPAKERIPEGLVYVPPGRFLYGSTDPEPLRRGFINTVPLHELRTEGFAIGRNEVTFAEWLDFLRALPPSERKVRMPDMMTREWGVQLEEDPTGAYRVVFVVSGERKVAGEGEMLSFPARNKRAEQDWRQFPVSGVSMEDAVAYVEWLAATGMVPGARLCTEYEWERAARGADDRVYPHGDAIRAEDANYDETYGRTTGAFAPDEIGSHPTSLSPFGLEDMAGNVLETVTSTRVEGEVLTRGGAAYFDRFGALVTNRTVAEPKTRDLWGGVRVCATAE